MRARASRCVSDQIPRSPWVILPIRSTAAASVNTRPAPPVAYRPRCTMCQSPATPSLAEYWHIGEITMRFRIVTSRTVSGVNSSGWDMAGAHSTC